MTLYSCIGPFQARGLSVIGVLSVDGGRGEAGVERGGAELLEKGVDA
jgi:hypothetical protein